MKLRSTFVFAATSVSAVLFLSASAHAGEPSPNIVLTVDITNPAAVVISSTGAPSLVSNSGQGFTVTLVGALSAPFQYPPSFGYRYDWASGGISAWNGRSYNGPAVEHGETEISLLGFSQFQAFQAGSPAFVGSGTVNFTETLPPAAGPVTISPAGTIGNVVITDNNGTVTNIIIGQYQIIPAPGAAALLGLGGLIAMRRRR